MSSTQPAIVLVPGAWTPPAAYAKLANALKARSFTVETPALPSNNGARPPNSSHEDDVAAVRKVIKSFVDDGKEVIVYMHSYGAVVGTNAVEGLTKKDREAQGLSGGVVYLFYLCGYLLAKGQSIWTVIEGFGVEAVKNHPSITFEDDGTWFLSDPVGHLCHDLDPEDQEEQRKLSTRQNMEAIKGKVAYEAWRDVPSTYIRTTEDRCVPPVFQDICLAYPKEANVPIDVKVLNCSHAPYAKYPDQLADMVVEVTRFKTG
ncbi:alpha/beta-hydrolase [Hypoxylon trugodes]|uniref:alpha/beta-hydrolase n=1 Tax=Hypoxylon trugodes TaxID=326681 RepID=UPI0021904214|nr:alpha/beta-hydrolase [Hypoxylon trugodes]KAI1389602.1 alpha/beta-hydrolase [Hypoxylon trugodes]